MLLLIVSVFCVVVCSATECPDHLCPESHTCCSGLAPDEFNCCPYTNAVCCLDGENCCPEDTLCDPATGGCITQEVPEVLLKKQGYHIMEENEIAHSSESEGPLEMVFCPDFSYCPKFSTCCLLPDSKYGCCPYGSGVCCKDMIHCCPEGESCDRTFSHCLGKEQHPSQPKWPALEMEYAITDI